jgi:hypothetical protein
MDKWTTIDLAVWLRDWMIHLIDFIDCRIDWLMNKLIKFIEDWLISLTDLIDLID